MGIMLSFSSNLGLLLIAMMSNMMENILAMTSVNSLRTLACIPPGPMDLCTIWFLKWSQTSSSLTVGSTSLPQSPSCIPLTWEVWKQMFPLKTEAKILSTISSSSSFVVCSLPSFFTGRGQGKGQQIPPLTFLYCLAYLPFLLCFCILCQIQSQMQFGLPHPTPTQPDCVPKPFPVYLASIACAFVSFPLIWLKGPYSCWTFTFLAWFLVLGKMKDISRKIRNQEASDKICREIIRTWVLGRQ